MISLILAAAVAATDAPALPLDMAATAAKARVASAQTCPAVPTPVRECANNLPCAKAELQRITQVHRQCMAAWQRVLACAASGIPVDVCIGGGQ